MHYGYVFIFYVTLMRKLLAINGYVSVYEPSKNISIQR